MNAERIIKREAEQSATLISDEAGPAVVYQEYSRETGVRLADVTERIDTAALLEQRAALQMDIDYINALLAKVETLK